MNAFTPLILVLLIGAAGCASSAYDVPTVGHFFHVCQKDGKTLFTVVDSHSVDGYKEVFRLARPLQKEPPPESKADFVFIEILDGKTVKEHVLYRDGEVLSGGQWSQVDASWHYRWRIMYDPRSAAEYMRKGEPADTAQRPSSHLTPMSSPINRAPYFKRGGVHAHRAWLI